MIKSFIKGFSILLVLYITSINVVKPRNMFIEYDSENYNFHLFENSDSCSQLYRAERVLLEKLKSIKLIFQYQKLEITDLYLTKNNIELMRYRKGLLNSTKKISATKMQILQTIEKFPSKKDWYGSLKAMITLQNVYNLNITSVVKNGEISYYDSNSSLIKIDVSTFSISKESAMNSTPKVEMTQIIQFC